MLKNGLYNAAAGAVRIGLGILTIPILIRMVGVEEYGLWTIASTVVGLIALVEGGLSVATTVFVSQDLGKEDVDGLSQTLAISFGAMLILATLAGTSLWIGAETFVNFFPKLRFEQHLAGIQALKIAGLVVWARLLQQVVVGVEQAYQHYGVMNLLITLQSILSSLGLLTVAWLGGKTVALIQCQALVSIGGLVVHAWVCWSLIRGIKLRLDWSANRGFAILRYSLMTWLTSLGSALFTQVDRVIVGTLLGTESLGVYAAITNVTSQVNTLSALPVQPLLPALSSLLVNPNQYGVVLRQQIKRAFIINILVAFGLGFGLFMLAPQIMHLMLSSGIIDKHILAFRLATIIYTTYSINAVGYYILFAVNAVGISLIINLLSGTLSLILIYVLCLQTGLIGAVIGNAGYLLSLLFIPFALKEIHLLKIKSNSNVISH